MTNLFSLKEKFSRRRSFAVCALTLLALPVLAQADARVRVIDIEARTTQGPKYSYTLTSAYVGFLLPLMVEIQHLVRDE